MNRPLRRRHLRMFVGLAPLTIATLAAAVLVRDAAPPNPAPVLFPDSGPRGLPPLDRREIRVGRVTVELRRFGDSATGTRVIELAASGEPRIPDLLVYWGTGPAETLPADAVLLGPFAGPLPVRFRLPDTPGDSTGGLYFYSGATGELLARADLTPGRAPAP